MSRINGDKARSAVERKRRTAQREKDRARRAQYAAGLVPKKAAPVKKVRVKKQVEVEAKPAAAEMPAAAAKEKKPKAPKKTAPTA